VVSPPVGGVGGRQQQQSDLSVWRKLDSNGLRPIPDAHLRIQAVGLMDQLSSPWLSRQNRPNSPPPHPTPLLSHPHPPCRATAGPPTKHEMQHLGAANKELDDCKAYHNTLGQVRSCSAVSGGAVAKQHLLTRHTSTSAAKKAVAVRAKQQQHSNTNRYGANGMSGGGGE